MKLLLGIRQDNQSFGNDIVYSRVETKATDVVMKGTIEEIKAFMSECDELSIELNSLYREERKIEDQAMNPYRDYEAEDKRYDEIQNRINEIIAKGGIRKRYETLFIVEAEIV